MIPAPGKTLSDLALRIATDLMPALNTNFTQADAGLITGLLLTMAQDYERAVDNRMQDMLEINALFAELRPDVPGHEARQTYLAKAPASYHLHDVTALHAEAFEHLIEVHAWAEDNDLAVSDTIWQLLRAHSERNKFDLPNM